MGDDSEKLADSTFLEKPGASLILTWITALRKLRSWLRCVQYYILLELQSSFNMHSMQGNGIYQAWAWQP